MSDQKKEEKPQKKRTRRVVPYPLCPFEEVVEFVESIYELGSGHKVRRVTLFDHIGKSPDSGPSRALVTNAGKYGLVKGGYQAEQIELTELAIRAFGENSSAYSRAEAKIHAAILDIEPFKVLFEKFSGNKMPAKTVLSDTLREHEIDESVIDTLVDIFVVNAEYVGLLQTLAGAERVVTIEHALETVAKSKEHRPEGVDQFPEVLRKPIAGLVTSGN